MTRLGWKVHTPSMLAEILNNPGMGIMSQPVRIFADLLAQVATRAAAIDDPELNILMMRLTLYDQADPEKHTFEEIQAHYTTQEKRLEAPREYTNHRGEILEGLPRERLIEIVRDLAWESEQRRQALKAIRA